MSLIVTEIRDGVGIRRGSVIGDFPYIYIYIYICIYIYIFVIFVIFISWSPFIPSKNLDEVFTYNHMDITLRHPLF